MTQSPTLGAVLGTGASGSQVRQDLNLSDQALASENAGPTAPSPTYPFMYWRDTTTNNLYRRSAANSGWEIVEYVATVDPTVNDDVADGFVMRSLWINTSGYRLFSASTTPPARRSGEKSPAAPAAP